MKLITRYDPPPIPMRDFDWSCIDDDTYDGAPDSSNRNMIGYGKTEQEAIDDWREESLHHAVQQGWEPLARMVDDTRKDN